MEFAVEGIPYQREKIFPVHYRGELLCEQHIDFVVGDAVVLEMKSVESLAPIHHSQLLNYMRIANVRVGLLVNFNVPVLKDGIKRKIL
jgi:GxxExxY protein